MQFETLVKCSPNRCQAINNHRLDCGYSIGCHMNDNTSLFTDLSTICSRAYPANNKETIDATHYWQFVLGIRWIPRTMFDSFDVTINIPLTTRSVSWDILWAPMHRYLPSSRTWTSGIVSRPFLMVNSKPRPSYSSAMKTFLCPICLATSVSFPPVRLSGNLDHDVRYSVIGVSPSIGTSLLSSQRKVTESPS